MIIIINKFLSNNLRTKLIIVILLTSLIPLLLLGFFSYKYISSILQEEISENELERLTSVNNQLTYFLQDVEQMSLFFYKNDQVKTILENSNKSAVDKYNDNQSVNELFDTIMSVKKWEVNIYIIGLNGDRYFSNEYLPSHYNNIRENWGIFRKAKEANGSMAWDTNYSVSKFEDKEVVLTAGRLIIDPSTNKKLGYIMIDINESAFSSIYKENNTFTKEQFFLLDNQGYVISSNPNKDDIGTKYEAPFLSRVLKGDSGFFKHDFQGTPSILSYHTADNTGFKLISIIPLDIVHQKNNLIRNLTWNFALIGIIISAWLAYYLSRTVTMPLYKLMFLMKEVEKGNLDVRFDSKYNDDIGIFGNRFNRMLRRLKVLLQESYEKQVRLQESELKALRAQINPHFLYNTLETVNWLARIKGSQDISKIIVSLGEIMRYSIKKGDNFVTVEEDIKQLENYLNIQEFRYRDKFTVYLHIDDMIKKEVIPSLLIQPIVENAIIHGLEAKMDKGNIIIIVTAKENGISIVVEDDGIGIDDETITLINKQIEEGLSINQLGIGIENVRKRLYLSYDNQFEWNLYSELNKGTRVEILVPYINKEGNSDA